MNRSGVRTFAFIKQRWPLIVQSAWIVFLTEFVSRGFSGRAFVWSGIHFVPFLFNLAIIFGFVLLLTALIGSARIAYWIVAAFSFTAALISGIKLKILGVPLLPWDFVLTSETKDMTPYIKNIYDWRLLLAVAVFVAVSIVLLHKFPHFRSRFGWKERAAQALLAVCLLAVLYTDKPVPVKQMLGIQSITWDQTDNVATNGLMLASLMNIEQMFVDRVKSYDKEAVDAFVRENPVVEKETADGPRPNIIVVLSEAFWDPTRIESARFSRDPLPFFHSLQETSTSGWMLSPQFGGGTANVEFEVLTGNSMRFLPQGSIAYNQYIHHGVDSLASILTRHGYTATAISPFHNWYFNSSNVYKFLGFAKYISIEFFRPIYSGPYIADSEVANNIIAESLKTDGPDFIFANTMENHFHYYPGKFEKNTIKVEGNFSEFSKGLLETYAQGVWAADNMLRTLVEHFESRGEPTIIVFFGDHLPALGDDYEVYKDTKYITGEDDPDFLDKMYRVPVVVWNNYLPKQKDTLNISTSFLGPYILKLAGIPGTPFTDYLYELSQRIPVIPPRDYYEAMNIRESDLKQYEAVQSDILFGDRSVYGELKDKIVQPGFTLGIGPMTISNVTPDALTAGSAATITVTGQNLPAQGVIYFNGKALETSWKEEAGPADAARPSPLKNIALSAELPASSVKPGTWDVQVKVIDSQKRVIAQSNVVQLQVRAKENAG
jgi:phosphoglycerol transferase MdoB-like AlkP superfamily enzyme